MPGSTNRIYARNDKTIIGPISELYHIILRTSSVRLTDLVTLG